MMLLNPYQFNVGGGGLPEPLLWSLTDKQTSFAISGDQKTATYNNGESGSAFSTLYRSTGKRYCEVKLVSGAGSIFAYDPAYHVAKSGFALSELAGNSALSWALLHNGNRRTGGAAASAYASSFGNGDTIGIAVDFGSGSIWFSKNGAWVGSGEPNAGATPAFTNVTGPVRPGVNCNSGFAATLIRGAADEFAYPIPTGFAPWSDPE